VIAPAKAQSDGVVAGAMRAVLPCFFPLMHSVITRSVMCSPQRKSQGILLLAVERNGC
jgi:hypothetical protein